MTILVASFALNSITTRDYKRIQEQNFQTRVVFITTTVVNKSFA